MICGDEDLISRPHLHEPQSQRNGHPAAGRQPRLADVQHGAYGLIAAAAEFLPRKDGNGRNDGSWERAQIGRRMRVYHASANIGLDFSSEAIKKPVNL